MDQAIRQRLGMAALGGFAGFSFYALTESLDRDLIAGRLTLVLLAFAWVFFASGLALSCAMRFGRALFLALCVALPVAFLLSLASLRFADASDVMGQPALILAAFFLGSVPLPFVIAAQSGSWRDYPALFIAAWTIVVRYAAAWLFVGVVWLVILLSNAVFHTIGLKVIETLLEIDAVPWLISGAVLGLAMAVVTELSDLIAPDLVLRLLRLLTPVVLLVLGVFIIALPIKGLSGLFSGFSTGAMLLLMVGLCTSLISVVVGQDNPDSAQSKVLRRSARALSLLIWVPALLAAVAVGMRVVQYGWTPDRITAAMLAMLALGYGGVYGFAGLRGAGWMARIRQGNIALALAGLGLAALSLTPILNAQAISARDQLARLRADSSLDAQFQIRDLSDLGTAGAAALAEVRILSQNPDRKVLSAILNDAGTDESLPKTKAALIAALNAEMPLRPQTANALRDKILAAQDAYTLSRWLVSCRKPLATGAVGCVFVAADFMPTIPGDEAIVLTVDADYNAREAFSIDDGEVMRHKVADKAGKTLSADAMVQIITAAQVEPLPQVVPLAINGLPLAGITLQLLTAWPDF